MMIQRRTFLPVWYQLPALGVLARRVSSRLPVCMDRLADALLLGY